MRSTLPIVIFIALIYAALLVAAPRPSSVSAEPRAQAATEEPTKRPYAFPTPVFIPTYADDTPVPRTTPSAGTAPIQPGVDSYTVQSGDSLWAIAQKVYGDGTRYKLIMQANDMTDQSKLRIGAVLKMPSVPGVAAPLSPTAASNPVVAETQPAATVALAPTVQPQATITPTPTRTSASAVNSDTIILGINLLSGILFLAGISVGVLGYLRYARLRRLERLSGRKQPIRVRQ